VPYATSSAASVDDAVAVAAAVGMKTEKIEITSMADAFLADIPSADLVRRGNVMARCRMIVLYDILPEAVLAKAPSADLWEGQSDEDELGFTYAEVDRLLVNMIDQGLGPKQLEALGFDSGLVARVAGRVKAMAFKRTAPPVAFFPGRVDPDRENPQAEPEDEPFTDGGFH